MKNNNPQILTPMNEEPVEDEEYDEDKSVYCEDDDFCAGYFAGIKAALQILYMPKSQLEAVFHSTNVEKIIANWDLEALAAFGNHMDKHLFNSGDIVVTTTGNKYYIVEDNVVTIYVKVIDSNFNQKEISRWELTKE